MDLPPPPPFHRRHHHDDHLRYENVLRPPDFIPHHLPPPPPLPPQTRSFNTLLPPPPPPWLPPPPMRHMPSPPPPRFAFSPPRYSITERSHLYEFDSPPKPYPHRAYLPPPPPQPPRENLPLRIVHDYPKRKPVVENENFHVERNDNIREFHENWDQKFRWDSSEDRIRPPDIDVDGCNRYFDVSSENFELYRKRDDGRRRDSASSGWGSDVDNKREFDERRYIGMNDRSHDLYRECDYYETRWDNGSHGQNHDLHMKHNFDVRRWEHDMSNQGCQSYMHVDDDEWRQDSGRSAGVLSRLGNKQPEFVENDLRFGGVLSRLGNRQTEFDENYLSLGGAFSRLGDRLPEISEGDLRFRLETGVSKGQIIRPDKKKRLQKKNALLRSPPGKVRNRKNGGFKSQQFAKDYSRGSFKVHEEGYGQLQTRMEVKREREQSPTELAISFRSNALVAKTIQVTSHPTTEFSIKSNSSVKERLEYSGSALPAAKPDVVSDMLFDPWGTPKEHMDTVSDSRSGSVTANSARDLGENHLKNTHPEVNILEGSSGVMFQETNSSWSRKKKRGMKQPLVGANMRMKEDTDAIQVDTCNPVAPKLKRNRNKGVNRLRAYEVARLAHENFLPNESASCGDSLGFNQSVNIADKYVSDKASVCRADKGSIGPLGQYDTLGSDRVHDVGEHPDLGEAVLLERSYTGGDFEDILHCKDHNPAGFSSPQETRNSEVHEDNYFSEIHKLGLARKSDCAVMKTTADAIVYDVGLKDANSEDLPPNQSKSPQVMLHANDYRSLEGAAVTYLPNVAFDVSVSSCSLSANDKVTSPEIEVSFPYNVGTVLSNNVYSVEGGETCLYIDNSSPKVITDKETCLSVDNSSKFIKKRKQKGAQTGIKASVNVQTVGSADGGVPRYLGTDIVSAMGGDFVGERDRCMEDTSLQEDSSGIKDSCPDVKLSTNGSSPGYRKKQKLSSPRLSLSSLSEDDTHADGLSNPIVIEQHSTRSYEFGAEQSGDTSSASITINQCGTTDVEGEVGINDLNVINLEEDLVDVDRSLESNDLAVIANGMSCSDRNGPSASGSCDESLASRFDIRSCMTSPEELRVYSDSCCQGNIKRSASLLESEMICHSDNISNKNHVIADPNTSSLGKCSGAAVNKSQANPAQPLLKGTSQVVKKQYPVHGRLTWSKNQVTSAITKVFPVQHPSNHSNMKNLYSYHATKTRTWCRTTNSNAAVAEPKNKHSPIPQTHIIKAARPIKSSYIRKGNSLVRTHSQSDDVSHGFPGSSCSVYRLSSCTNTKNDLATKCKTDNADAPTLKRRGQINTPEMTKALTLNQSGNSLSCTSCNMEEPLPVSNHQSKDFPSKIFDVMKDRIKSSPVAECQTDSVIKPDSHSAAGEGNTEKKIIYVKRRSNQLVATSKSDDMSILGVDTTESQLSDGYYKSRGNQLLRASSENHIKRGNASAPGLTPHSLIPKTSSRRQSGFAKTCRYSKLSFVWKLHGSQSSEKPKNTWAPQKVWPNRFSYKRAAYWRSLLGIKPSLSNVSQKLLVSRKRGAIYTRSSHGYSLKMSKVLSVCGSSLKWSKSIEKSSKKANEEATRAVAAAEKRKKEEKSVVPIAKNRNHVSRKWVLNVKLRPGERIFRIGSERYKMDPTRRTLQRITEKEPSSPVALQSRKTVKRSYIPRRLLIGNEEYVRIGNGNQLVRDPKKRVRVLASEKVRWSLRTARLRLARKRKYCQFFTRFGKCNKDDGKCLYIHDPSKIVVCTKFLTGSCTDINCKLTHKVIPERMQDCSYFLKGSCSNDTCPYRHVHVSPDSSVCESFLRGYCADGNECQKKHTYVCPVFEATGVCPQASTCKLHHPKKKPEVKPTRELKVVRGRYFDGGLVEADDDCCSTAPTEKPSSEGKDDIVVHEGKFPDFISLEVGDDEILPDAPAERCR